VTRTLGTYDFVLNPQMVMSINLGLVSDVTAELRNIFDCKNLMMLLDGVVGMSTALNVSSSGLGYVEKNYSPNKTVMTLRLAHFLASSDTLPTRAAGTCQVAGLEPCRGRRRERTELAGYKLYQKAATLAVCAGSAGGTRKKRCAMSLHPALICCAPAERQLGSETRPEVGPEAGGFGAQLQFSWRLADQSRMQSIDDPQNAQKKYSSRQKAGQRRNTVHYHGIVHPKRAGFGVQLPHSRRSSRSEQGAIELPAGRPK
jgi:hypothetical protein